MLTFFLWKASTLSTEMLTLAVHLHFVLNVNRVVFHLISKYLAIYGREWCDKGFKCALKISFQTIEHSQIVYKIKFNVYYTVSHVCAYCQGCHIHIYFVLRWVKHISVTLVDRCRYEYLCLIVCYTLLQLFL